MQECEPSEASTRCDFGSGRLTASQKVHLRRCASSFVTAAYFYVRLIPQDSRALHLELFTVPSTVATFCEIIKIRFSTNGRSPKREIALAPGCLTQPRI
jgi:hypothetical protein